MKTFTMFLWIGLIFGAPLSYSKPEKLLPFQERGEKLTLKGELYFPQKQDPPQNLIYTFQRFESNTKNSKKVRAVYLNTKNEVVATEATFYENGQLVRYELDHKQINDQATVEIKDGKITFKYTEAGKKKDTETDTLDENFLVADSFVPFVHKNWDRLNSGKEIKVYYPVPYLQDTIGFFLKKKRETQFRGKPVIELEMRGSGLITSMVIDPFLFTFDAKTKKLIKVVGRTIPREFKNGKWVDWDALILYQEN